jgi:hypothetical protein
MERSEKRRPITITPMTCHWSQSRFSMSSAQNDEESILALDGGVDDRDSASSSSSEGVDNPPAQAPSRASQLYQTPDARSHTSSIGQRVKNKLIKLSGGRVCILTKESTPLVSIEAAHLVPRAAAGTLVHPHCPRSIRLTSGMIIASQARVFLWPKLQTTAHRYDR